MAGRNKSGIKMDKQSIVEFVRQDGVFHGLLAGLAAIIRGTYEGQGFRKSLLDMMFCVLLGTFVFSIPGFDKSIAGHRDYAIIAAMCIGMIGTNLIVTTVRESFKTAISQLNPLNWFKKGK